MNEQVLDEARVLIAGFLSARREESGITQEQLAELTGLGRATIQRFEAGRFWIGMKQYLLICHHLKCYPFLSTMEGKDEFATLMRERWDRKGDKN